MHRAGMSRRHNPQQTEAMNDLFTLTVVEPMMVGILGGGFTNLRLPDGQQTILEGQGSCPMAVGPETFTPDPDAVPACSMRWAGATASVAPRWPSGRAG